MKKHQIKAVDVLNPCSANWNDMTPEAKGAFCSTCKTTVIDFVGKSDRYIRETYLTNNGDICGRFSAHQLNRPLVVDRSEQRFQLAHLLLAGVVLTTSMALGTEPFIPPTIEVVSPYEETGSMVDRVLPMFEIGLMDEETREAIPFVRVSLLDANNEVIGMSASDLSGYVAFKPEIWQKAVTIRIDGVRDGYELLTITKEQLSYVDDSRSIVSLKQREMELFIVGEVIHVD